MDTSKQRGVKPLMNGSKTRENCLWYFAAQKLCYDQMAVKYSNETCQKWHDQEAAAKLDIREEPPEDAVIVNEQHHKRRK
jgi:hypothetical protein